MGMSEKIEWKDVINHDQLMDYIKERIGMENLYDELYEELVYGMCKNREEKQKQEKLNKKLSNMDGIIMPNGKQ
jgi:retron-type reverse transcriptase